MPVMIGATNVPDLTLNIDTSGTAFGAAPTFTDHTLDTMMIEGVQITWGRQDEQSEPSPRTATFSLKNADGKWTPGSATAPAGWDVGSRVRVTVTDNSVDYERFDGYVDAIEPTWVGGVQTWNVARVTCTDVTARTARSQPLRSMVVQEMLADSPSFLYPLDEASGAVSFGDISPNVITAGMVVASKFGAGEVTSGTDALFDSQTGVSFDSTNAGLGTTPRALSAIRLGEGAGYTGYPPVAGGFTWEMWFRIPTAPTTAFYLWAAKSVIADTQALIFMDTTGLAWLVGAPNNVYASAYAATNALAADGRWHHMVGTFSADGLTVTTFFDGVASATATSAAAVSLAAGFDRSIIGAELRRDGKSIYGLRGDTALVAQYPGVLSAARVLAHYQAGKGTLLEQSGARYARLAAYGNVTTSGLPTGSAQMGAQNTAGASVTDALAKVARTEGSASFTTGEGTLTFQDRTARYNATAALTLAAGDIRPPTVRRDRQGMANEMSVSRDGGATQRFVNAAKQTADGRFDGGSLEVAPSTDADALNNAAWRVHLRKAPQTRIPSVEVNLLASTTAIRAGVLAATVSTLLTVTGLPSQAPASSMSLFVEGGTETISGNDWHVEFFTSPNLPITLRADGAASAYTALDAGLVIPL